MVTFVLLLWIHLMLKVTPSAVYLLYGISQYIFVCNMKLYTYSVNTLYIFRHLVNVHSA